MLESPEAPKLSSHMRNLCSANSAKDCGKSLSGVGRRLRGPVYVVEDTTTLSQVPCTSLCARLWYPALTHSFHCLTDLLYLVYRP